MSHHAPQPSVPLPWLERGRRLVTPLLLSGLLLGGLALLIQQARDPQVLPVRVVGVDGKIAHLDRRLLERSVAEAVDGSFFSVDLKRIRRKLEQLPWIESASVRRIWPDTLRVQVAEKVPLAYWGDDGLVSQRGEVFRPERLPVLKGLAVLEGADESALRITRQYRRMGSLLESVGLRLDHVWVDARQAWRLRMDDDVVVNLGRREVMSRLTRFVQLYPYLQQQAKRLPQEVDLRYTNGFTVRWRDAGEAQVNGENRAAESEAAKIAGI